MSAGNEAAVVLVTGGSSGIGSACARLFASRGYAVAVAATDIERARTVCDGIALTGADVMPVEVDVRDESSVHDAVRAVLDRWGRLDVAHNNAGVRSGGMRTHEFTKDEWDDAIGTNLTGVWLCMKHELMVMAERGTGSVVNTASIAGHIGYLNAAPYTAAKHGVIGLTKAAAVEYGPLGIRVNAVSPGPVKTPMLDAALAARGPGASDWYLENTPMHRFATVDEIASAVLWVASDEASFMTGQSLVVDGGWTAR